MASTNGATNRFPPIVLDTTLHDLLAQDKSPVTESLCNVKPNPEPKFQAVPTNYKYLITSTPGTNGDDLAHLQMENVSYLLSFWAGRMEVCLLASEGWSEDDTLTQKVVESNAVKAWSVLEEDQRPKPRYLPPFRFSPLTLKTFPWFFFP